MLIAVRPAKYKDDEEDNPGNGDTDEDNAEKEDKTHPVTLYICLLVYHSVFAYFSFSEAFDSNSAKYIRFIPAVLIIATVVMLSKVHHNWLYLPGESRD